MKATIILLSFIGLLSTSQAVVVHHRSNHRLGHRSGHRGRALGDDSTEAQDTFEMVENKKVFKDDYGKDIVDDDYVDALERMNDERLGHKKK